MERKKRIILIGRSAAGKTSLCQAMNHEDIRYHKTQTVHVLNQTMIDTPGEYLERTHMRGALFVSATDADVIVLVQDATENGTMFPPAFTSQYGGKPAVGVVTKSDLASPEQIAQAKNHLEMAGVHKIFITSSVAGSGISALLAHLGYKDS